MCSGDSGYAEKDVKQANDEKNKTPDGIKQGMVMDRSCTDVLMCLIFFLFFCGMFATAAYGYYKGDPTKLINPYDSSGNQCGSGNLTAYSYLFWPRIDEFSATNRQVIDMTVCVKNCPKYGETSICYTNKVYTTCPKAQKFSTYGCNYSLLLNLYNDLDLSRFCLPNITTAKDYLLENVSSGNLGRYMGDLGTAWYIFLIMLGISLVLCLIYLFLLRCAAKPLLYISFVLIFALLLGGGFYVFYLGDRYESGDHTRSVMRGMGILLWILCGLYSIILLCCCSRIRLGIAIMEAASDFVRNTPQIFFVPFIFFFIIAVWVTFWIFSAIWVFSVGDPVKRQGLPLADIEWNSTTRYVWIYHLFGLFWVSAFIIGCAQFIIAATTCVWYFSHGGQGDDKAKASLSTGFRWIFRYHMGSIAFGALIIAIMQMIKLAFEYLRKKYEKIIPNNPCTKCVICCLRCFIWCLDCCVKFITKNAYIQIALTNKNFCSAAWLTFCLIVRNVARFSIITSIGAILIFVGKALIIIFSGWIAYLIMMNSDLKDKIYSPVFPIIVVCIIAYILASVFLSVYSFAANSILHCYLVDEEVGGNRQPASLHDFITKNDNYNKGKSQPAPVPKDDAKKAQDLDKPSNNVA